MSCFYCGATLAPDHGHDHAAPGDLRGMLPAPVVCRCDGCRDLPDAAVSAAISRHVALLTLPDGTGT